MIEWRVNLTDSPELIIMNMAANYPPFHLKIYSELNLNKQKAKVNCLILKEVLSRDTPELAYLYKGTQLGDNLSLSKWIGKVVGIKKKELEQIALGEDVPTESGVVFPKESFKED